MRWVESLRCGLWALIAVLLLVADAVAQSAERRVALVVGNSQYVTVSRLDNPVHDARLIAETLTTLGFTLVGGQAQLDLDKTAFESTIQAFSKAIQGAEVALLYYAGHGIQVRGANYLVPVNANPTREADIDFQLLNVDLILRQMELAGTRLNLLILDACRNNPFAGRGLRTAGGGLAQMQAPEGTLLAYATQPGNVAQDGADGHSPYTRALAKAMSTPGLDVFAVFNAVGVAVKKGTGGAQQPWVSSSPLEGQFYFAGTSSTQPPPVPVATALAPPSGPRAASRLRSVPTTLSVDDAKAMIVTQNFYRAGWHTQGKGGTHQYETQVLSGGLVVLDHAAGLMWQRGGSNTIVQGGFVGAEQFVRELNTRRFGGFADWRLPTLEEAMSLMTPPEEGQSPPGRRQNSTPQEGAHIAPVFEKAGAYFIWTSDLQAPGRGWVVYFVEGTCHAEVLGYNAYVRAVRSLQP